MKDKTCAIVCALDICMDLLKGLTVDAFIAVDKGYEHLTRHGITADMCIGDFDSLGYVPHVSHAQIHPVDKDESDLALALIWAKENGYTKAFVFGAIGGRFDHTLAAQQEMSAACARGVEIVAIAQDHQEVYMSEHAGQNITVSFKEAGETFSVFALSDVVEGVSIQGAKWDIHGAHFMSDKALGLSNVAREDEVRIHIKKGRAVVFCPLHKDMHFT